MHAHDVGGRERARDLGLAQEAIDHVALDEQLRVNELHRRLFLGVQAHGLVDLAHRAATDDAAEAEWADHLAGEATDAADAHRLYEIVASLVEERVALREAADDHVVSFDGVERGLARLPRDGVDGVEDALDEEEDDDPLEQSERRRRGRCRDRARRPDTMSAPIVP